MMYTELYHKMTEASIFKAPAKDDPRLVDKEREKEQLRKLLAPGSFDNYVFKAVAEDGEYGYDGRRGVKFEPKLYKGKPMYMEVFPEAVWTYKFELEDEEPNNVSFKISKVTITMDGKEYVMKSPRYDWNYMGGVFLQEGPATKVLPDFKAVEQGFVSSKFVWYCWKKWAVY